MKTRMKALILSLSLIVVAGITNIYAETVTIGMRTNPTALDPHFSKDGGTQMISMQFFETLYTADDKMTMQPMLAESVKVIDKLTYEFKLRKGVKFHDGSDFTAEDVVFSLKRARDIKNSAASFASSVKPVKEMKIIDPYTLQITTKKPSPLLVKEVSRIYIVSHKAAANASTEDFNSGKAAVGTGSYKLVKWTSGEQIVMKRFEDYWGDKPHFEDVIIKNISNDASRVAGLLSGSLDIIDQVPPSDMEMLKNDQKITLWPVSTARLIYLHMDHARDKSPFITDDQGNQLAKNPFKDKRVRLALSKLINRDALISRTLYGLGEPSGQMVPEGVFGYNPDLKPMEYDPKGALALLAEAGYPEGFGVTVHGPNNRYLYDAQVIQTVAQFLARGKIKVKVETMPKNVYFKRATAREFSLFLVGYGTSSGDGMSGLSLVLATYNKETKMGSNNRGRYSNPEYDAIINKAMIEVNEPMREKMLQDAAVIAFGDIGIIPMYFQASAWATRSGIQYNSRRDERTLARNIVPAM
ncbi:MAG: ABC transporter substrate-binding protein [SAR324 cluster bacterium]|nr:ABC transporter substrate-binding protein [SAR324 cluster bacterium]